MNGWNGVHFARRIGSVAVAAGSSGSCSEGK